MKDEIYFLGKLTACKGLEWSSFLVEVALY